MGFLPAQSRQEAWSTGARFDLRFSLQDYPLIGAAKARLRSASN